MILVHLREDVVLANRVLMMSESGQSPKSSAARMEGRHASQNKLRLIPRENRFQAPDLCTPALSAKLRLHIPGELSFLALAKGPPLITCLLFAPQSTSVASWWGSPRTCASSH